ncbi:hypothetical protein OHC33_003817 [Knufia fluminis]|uniref:NAD dependent epimerase/dehydratase n=1 Tax=Knufia fluminis TaxID=191047 RepID=A0AAN8F2F4_9EURO|nr:hypothetical protein OHC33_003817 [Knufia fluminis]
MRKIDAVKAERSKPMRVLVLGISRTGTSSICQALSRFGYRTFHMDKNIENPKLFPLWEEAVRAKFNGEGKPYGKAEFDKLLGDFDALSDLPAALFGPELIEAYPDAKVILTYRDAEKWVDSMQSTIWLAHSWWTFDLLTPFNSLIRGWRSGDTLDWDAFINSSPDKPSIHPKRRDYQSKEYRELGIKRFNEHNAYIRSIVPKERLLEFQSQDGWTPLCEFLGEEVPDEPYPRVNDKVELVKMAAMVWWIGVGSALLQTVAPVGVAVGAGWLARRYGWL